MKVGKAIALVLFLFATSGPAFATDPVVFALSQRHPSYTIEKLEELAGGSDNLVEKLLELRTQESPAFVGVRAERLLLQYADRPEVRSALESDLESEQYQGLARIITVHIDKVADSSARQSLARKALQRAARDSSFSRYARGLANSSDAAVSRMARESLE